uniref:MBD domain-containing protein n=1 Tax=Haptolina brevifila TaxID=156173 RepID=A0A7S2D5B3_9EUKA
MQGGSSHPLCTRDLLCDLPNSNRGRCNKNKTSLVAEADGMKLKQQATEWKDCTEIGDGWTRCRVPRDAISGSRGAWYFVAPSGQVFRSRSEVRQLLGEPHDSKAPEADSAGDPRAAGEAEGEGDAADDDSASKDRAGATRRIRVASFSGPGTSARGSSSADTNARSSDPAPDDSRPIPAVAAPPSKSARKASPPADAAPATSGASVDAAPPPPAVPRKRPPPHCVRLEVGSTVSPGDQVVALDVRNVWCEAKVVRLRQKGQQSSGGEPAQMAAVRLRFAGWGPEWDEWVALDSGKIAVPDDQYKPRPDPTLTKRAKEKAKQQPEAGPKEPSAAVPEPAEPAAEIAAAGCDRRHTSEAQSAEAHVGPVKKRKVEEPAPVQADASSGMSWEAARRAAQEAEAAGRWETRAVPPKKRAKSDAQPDDAQPDKGKKRVKSDAQAGDAQPDKEAEAASSTEVEPDKKRKKKEERRRPTTGGIQSAAADDEQSSNVRFKVKGVRDRGEEVTTHSGRVSVAPSKLAASEYSELPQTNRVRASTAKDRRRPDNAQVTAGGLQHAVPAGSAAPSSAGNNAQASAAAPSETAARVLPGDRVWALDVHQNWTKAQVVKMRDRRIKIHFIGWAESFDMWKEVDSGEVQPFSPEPPAPPVARMFAVPPEGKPSGSFRADAEGKASVSPLAAAAAASLAKSGASALPPHMRAESSSVGLGKHTSPSGMVAASTLTTLGEGAPAGSFAGALPSSSLANGSSSGISCNPPPNHLQKPAASGPNDDRPELTVPLISSLPLELLHALLAGLQLQREQFKALRRHAVHTFSPNDFLVRLNMCSTGAMYMGAQIVNVKDDEVQVRGIELADSVPVQRTKMQYISNQPFSAEEITGIIAKLGTSVRDLSVEHANRMVENKLAALAVVERSAAAATSQSVPHHGSVPLSSG